MLIRIHSLKTVLSALSKEAKTDKAFPAGLI